MLHRDIRKKQPTAWPWVAGLAVLALLGWGVSALLAPPPPELEPETDAAVEIRRPAPIPNTHRQRFVPESPGLDALAPLARDDAGERVQVEGEVLAVTDEAFWILVDRRVLRVDTPLDLRPGDRVATGGVLTASGEETPVPGLVERRVEREGWTLIRSLRLVPTPRDDGRRDR